MLNLKDLCDSGPGAIPDNTYNWYTSALKIIWATCPLAHVPHWGHFKQHDLWLLNLRSITSERILSLWLPSADNMTPNRLQAPPQELHTDSLYETTKKGSSRRLSSGYLISKRFPDITLVPQSRQLKFNASGSLRWDKIDMKKWETRMQQRDVISK